MSMQNIEEIIFEEINACTYTCDKVGAFSCMRESQLDIDHKITFLPDEIKLTNRFALSEVLKGGIIKEWLQCFSVCSMNLITYKFLPVYDSLEIKIHCTICIRKSHTM